MMVSMARHTLEQKKKLVHVAINGVFAERCKEEMHKFAEHVQQKIMKDIELQLNTGLPVYVEREDYVMNVAEPSEDLYSLIVFLLEDE